MIGVGCRVWWRFFLCLAWVLLPASWVYGNPSTGFRVLPAEVESAELESRAHAMMASGFLQQLAGALNKLFVLPGRVGLRYSECGEANAFYDPDTRIISICLELPDEIETVLRDQYIEEDPLVEAMSGALLVVVLHEVGHALVDVLDLRVKDREEDAVDQLAAWILVEAGHSHALLGAAASYYSDDTHTTMDVADEHSLDSQRYLNLVCWAYGADPASGADLVEHWELPPERAGKCKDEYRRLDVTWSRLLAGHVRSDNPLSSKE
jgi:hypothetical protein